jgi:hypothetical protein
MIGGAGSALFVEIFRIYPRNSNRIFFIIPWNIDSRSEAVMINEPFSSPSFKLLGTSNGTDSQNQLNSLNIPARDTTCDRIILVLSVVCGFDLSDCQ